MINIRQNTILVFLGIREILGKQCLKTCKNSNFRTSKKRENISRPRFYGEWDRKTNDYQRIGPDLTVIFFLLQHL